LGAESYHLRACIHATPFESVQNNAVAQQFKTQAPQDSRQKRQPLK
jgi:hypothetical protein